MISVGRVYFSGNVFRCWSRVTQVWREHTSVTNYPQKQSSAGFARNEYEFKGEQNNHERVGSTYWCYEVPDSEA
jgi:hypothetical protein